MQHATQEFTEAQMLIRKPAATVFEALINPEITTKFWFTHSDGILTPGACVTWTWEMYGASTPVEVLEFVADKTLTIRWAAGRTATFTLEPHENGTYVVVRETGYTETGDALLAAIKDATGGFTTVLDGMKAWLEYGVALGLIADKFPHKR